MQRFHYKTILLVVFLISNIHTLSAQYGNEWINYSQEYYKIPVAQTGMYRITYNQLLSAGFPVNSINPKKIQMYHRGQEQAILVVGEADNVFDPSDYVEFYGKKNDGTMDASLYTNAANQVNKYYNLYSDTTAYFISYTLDASLGKRISTYTGTNTSLETYHWGENLQVFSDQFYQGQAYPLGSINSEIYLSDFDSGEGWFSNSLTLANAPLDITFSVPNINTSITTCSIELGMVSSGPSTNAATISIGNSTSSLTQIATSSIQYYGSQLITQTFSTSLITGTGQAVIRIKATTGFIGVAYVKLRFPQTFDMSSANSKYFNIVGGASTSTIDILNPPSNVLVYDITDENNLIAIAGTPSAGKITCNIGNTTVERNLFVYNGSAFLSPGSISKSKFVNINPLSYNYLVITHKKLRVPISGVGDAVQAYASYRASSQGGSYTPLIMEIDVLYDQFNYGERSPLAIRKFANYMYVNGAPQHIFLIGQSVTLPDPFTTLNIRKNPTDQALDLVPTFGFPPSDNQFTIGLNPGIPTTPVIPIGRLNTSSPTVVNDYLNKVKEYEDPLNWSIWKKNIVHLSGGKTTSEQTTFKAYIDSFKSVAENGLYAAKVTSFSKQTTNAVELINISGETNNGLGLITFFGHSGKDITDIEIGYVSDDIQGYRNKGKYPMVIANGCQLASIFYNSTSLSQDWIFTKDRGAINFIAHTFIGFSNPLRAYTTYFYNTAFNDSQNMYKPVGALIQRLIGNYTAPAELDMSVIQQMLLQGDPANKLVPGNKPDYALSSAQLFMKSFLASPVTAISDSFQIKIAVYNLGIKDPRPLQVSIKRTFPNGTIKTYTTSAGYSPINNLDTIYFTLKKDPNIDAFGLNRFEVMLDYLNDIDEINENNNIGILDYYFPGIGVIPILPNEFSIVNTQPVVLSGMASDLLNANKRDIIFELDTTIQFNSPSKKTFTQTAPGAVASWSVNLLGSGLSHDSTVYYWRVNYADQVNNVNSLWGQSSFVYISTSPEGWYQGDFSQFLKDPTTNISRNTNARSWDFQAQQYTIQVNNCGVNAGCNYISDVYMLFNNLPLVFNGTCGNNVMNVMSFNKNTGQPYPIPLGGCGRQPFVAASYADASISAGAITNYINSVATGDYVLLFTTGSIDFSNWTLSQKTALQQIGANPAIVNTLQTGYPYIIFGKKGSAPGTAVEIVSGNLSNPKAGKTTLNTSISLQSSQGTIESTLIGPAKQWRSLFNYIKKFPNDSYQLNLLGVNFAGQQTTLFNNINVNSLNIGTIDPIQYPYLKFSVNLTDNVNFNPAQLKKWMVLYDGVPEGYINTDIIGKDKYLIKDKQEGETFNLDFAFQNLTNLPFSDSLVVEFTFTNINSNKISKSQIKIKAPQAKDIVRFSTTVNTIGMPGDNELRVFVNPRIQVEQFYENNILTIPYKVVRDNSNPILEVAFDGRQIIDGEIVAPKPVVAIRIRDNNKFLVSDTSQLDISIKRPCSTCDFEKISNLFDNLTFSSVNGITDASYQARNTLDDGVYTLRVQGSGPTKTKSGNNPYLIHFEVVNESSVTNFFPYPNPFSTSTRFVFTLTGAQVPDQIKIQIMTVTGKIVREITQDELGPIHVGNNLSNFAWNGTDEFGDQLANGVYLYRVIIRKNGESIQQRQTAADKAFKQGFGKLYILR